MSKMADSLRLLEVVAGKSAYVKSFCKINSFLLLMIKIVMALKCVAKYPCACILTKYRQISAFMISVKVLNTTFSHTQRTLKKFNTINFAFLN